MNKTMFILGCLIIAIGITGTVMQAFDSIEKNGQVTKVDCFDKFGNKIDGVMCTETYNGLERFTMVFVLGGLGTVLGGSMCITYAMFD